MALKKLPDNPDETKMSLGEHLDELRVRIIRALLGLALAMGLTLWFGSEMIKVLQAPFYEAAAQCNIPDAKLVTHKAPEAFMMYFRVCLLAGFILASPWIFYQMWLFIAAGLYPHERKYVNWGVPFSAGLFCLGAFTFLYFIAKQMMLFFLGFGDSFLGDVTQLLNLREYIALMTTMMLVFGLAFQLPIVIFILGKMGLVTVKQLNHYRRHAIVAILIIAALATSPSPVDQVGLAIPLWLLYEIGILLVYFYGKDAMERKRAKKAAAEGGTALATAGGGDPYDQTAATFDDSAGLTDATARYGQDHEDYYNDSNYDDEDYDEEDYGQYAGDDYSDDYGEGGYGGEDYGEDYEDQDYYGDESEEWDESGFADDDQASAGDETDDVFEEEGGYVWSPPGTVDQADDDETEDGAEADVPAEDVTDDGAEADESVDDVKPDESADDETDDDVPVEDETDDDEKPDDES